MTFIYFHGFNSQGNPASAKLEVLRELGDVITLDYNSFTSYEEILSDLKQKVSKKLDALPYGEAALVGTSLGGYWAATLSGIYGVPAIILNPSIRPSKTLTNHAGMTLENFVSGEVNTLHEDVPKSYPDLVKDGILLIMLDEGDEVLDSFETQKYFTDYEPTLFKGGSHRFEHMKEALPEIKKFLTHTSPQPRRGLNNNSPG